MSMQRYMNTVRSQNRGVIQGADDTDMKKKEKKKKKKQKKTKIDEETVFAPEVSDLSQITTTFRHELNDCLSREQWNE